jgi:hypothetical protein
MANEEYQLSIEFIQRIIRAVKKIEAISLNEGLADYGMASSNRQAIRVKATSIVSGQGGRYNGKILTYGANGAASGNLAAADIGTPSATENCIIWDLSEIGGSTHNITLANDAEATFIGHLLCYDSTTKKPIIAVKAGGTPTGSTTSPTTIGQSSEGGDAALTNTWTKTSGNPLDLWVVSRVVYSDAGDQVLYAYARKLTFDTLGALATVSAETRYAVDTPGSC